MIISRFILLLYFVISLAQGAETIWQVVSGYDLPEPKSLYFASSQNNFTCPSVHCSEKELKSGFAYFMAATSHSNTFEMLVFRVCRYLQTCIRHNQIFITLHHTSELDEGQTVTVYKNSAYFLTSLSIPHNSWPGQFTSNTKMVHYLESLNGLQDPNKYVFHSDLDEIVDPHTLRKAMDEMERGECDAIAGVWQDRLTLDGTLKSVEIDKNVEIEQQFPLRCSYSVQFMPERTTRKVIVYRSNLRLTSGQHEIWCNIGMTDPNTPYSPTEACKNHIAARADKTTKDSYIYKLIPHLKARPRICNNVVIIDHYKFINGVQEHLTERMNSYKNLGLVWWKQSAEILDDIKKHDNKLCTVKCPKFKCYLKDLPKSQNIGGMFKIDPKVSEAMSSALNTDSLSKDIKDTIEKAIGFKVFAEQSDSLFLPESSSESSKSSQENFSEEDIIAPAINLTPEESKALEEGNKVAVTTLYDPKEDTRAPPPRLSQVPLNFTLNPVPHPSSPVIGMVGELDVLSRMETLPQLLVFGDSIMFSLNELKEIWYPFQKRYNAVNLAVKGERVHSLLHRVRFSDWDLLYEGKEGLKMDNRVPLVVIIMIGTNDIGKGESFLTVAASIDMIVKECILKIPRISHIFVFSVLPRALEAYNTSINDLNRKISELYAHSKILNGSITFVDLTPLFRAKDFSIKKNMYLADRFHPSFNGYHNILKATRPLLDEIFITADAVSPTFASSSSSSSSSSGSDKESATLDAQIASSSSSYRGNNKESASLDAQIASVIKEKENGMVNSNVAPYTKQQQAASSSDVFKDLSNTLIDLEKE